MASGTWRLYERFSTWGGSAEARRPSRPFLRIAAEDASRPERGSNFTIYGVSRRLAFQRYPPRRVSTSMAVYIYICMRVCGVSIRIPSVSIR